MRTPVEEERHEKGMKAARARAEWELGDPSWAEWIVGAYLHPEADAKALAREINEREA